MATNQRHSYVEFYPSDWTAGTAFMPVAMEWLYLQVCLYNWDKAEPLPPAEAAMRFSRSASAEADLATLIAAGKVIRTQGGGLFVTRAMTAANKARDLWERKSRGGRARQSAENQRPDEGDGKTAGKSHGKTATANENENENESLSLKDKSVGAGAGDLLFQISADALKALRDHRVRIKAPMTAHAEGLMVAKLEKIWREHRHDPTAVIDQSIENGWRGVFPLKHQETGNGGGNRQGGRANGADDGFNRAVDRGLGLD